MKAAWTVLGLLAGAYVWTVIASGIYCLGTGLMEKFDPPFLQWWQVLPWWRANWWVTTWFVVGALVPTAIAVLAAVRWLRRSRERPGLYGRTDWASAAELVRGGFDLRGQP